MVDVATILHGLYVRRTSVVVCCGGVSEPAGVAIKSFGVGGNDGLLADRMLASIFHDTHEPWCFGVRVMSWSLDLLRAFGGILVAIEASLMNGNVQ